MTADMRDVLHTPYVLGGRTVGIELDCLGVVGEVARRRGLPAPDGWPSILKAMKEGRVASGFPPGWRRQSPPFRLQDGDVLVLPGDHPGCAIVHGGRVYTAHPDAGVHAIALSRWNRAASEVWRFEP